MFAGKLIAALCGLAALSSAHAGPLGDPVPVGQRPKIVVAPRGTVVPPAQFESIQELTPAPAPVSYAVVPSDTMFRSVISRWAKSADWTFEPEHWTVARDIPVGGRGDLGTDFKTAVRALLRSTLMSDMPVKPCFYLNNVVRVVSTSAKCDPTKD